jgi:hypothetical protein
MNVHFLPGFSFHCPIRLNPLDATLQLLNWKKIEENKEMENQGTEIRRKQTEIRRSQENVQESGKRKIR